jgi:hypothetical protein
VPVNGEKRRVGSGVGAYRKLSHQRGAVDGSNVGPELSKREDFGLAKVIGSSAVVVGAPKAIGKPLANYVVTRPPRIAAFTI